MFMLKLFKEAFPAKEVMNFHPSSPDFKTKILPDLARDWAECSKRKFHGYDFMSGGQPGGTILAVDGYVQPILPPSAKDLKGMNRKIFWNRKGYPGLTCQAACDAFGRLKYFDVLWPGAKPDIRRFIPCCNG